MSCTTDTYALSEGNDFPVTITLKTNHGATLSGRTIQAYLALTEGGAAIAVPDTTITLTEDTSSPATARVYRGAIDATVVDDLVAAQTFYWLAITDPDDLLVWERVPVTRYRRAG